MPLQIRAKCLRIPFLCGSDWYFLRRDRKRDEYLENNKDMLTPFLYIFSFFPFLPSFLSLPVFLSFFLGFFFSYIGNQHKAAAGAPYYPSTTSLPFRAEGHWKLHPSSSYWHTFYLYNLRLACIEIFGKECQVYLKITTKIKRNTPFGTAIKISFK